MAAKHYCKGHAVTLVMSTLLLNVLAHGGYKSSGRHTGKRRVIKLYSLVSLPAGILGKDE